MANLQEKSADKYSMGLPGPNPSAKVESSSTSWLLLFACLTANVVLSLIMKQSPVVATVHAVGVFVIGLVLVVMTSRPEQCAIVVAYVSGSEVLWRMCSADIFWEAGKYAASVLLILSIIRSRKFTNWSRPFFYFLVLLPSTLLILLTKDFASIKQDLSFNLSGPLSLAICVWFFSRLRTTPRDLQKLFMAALGPIAGIGAIAASGIMASSSLRFFTKSNFDASGGFGPVQVSSILALGALLCFLYLTLQKGPIISKVIVLLLMIWMIVQSALTFSRGGLYSFAGAAIAGLLFLASDRRRRMRTLIAVGALALLGNYLLLPELERLTGGAIVERFSSTNTTGRDKLMASELDFWIDHPIMGVGPGQAARLRTDPATGYRNVSHTEFTRLLGEHGVFGITAVVLLLVMGVSSVRSKQSRVGRAISAALVVWCFLFMASDGMRFIAVAFAFGVAQVAIDPTRTGGSLSTPGKLSSIARNARVSSPR